MDLGLRGVRTTVIEKEEDLHRIPKGQNLTQRTMEHFRYWGIAEQIRAARLMPAGYPAGGINAYENLMSDFAHPWFRRAEVDQYYFARNERLPQYLTEKVLRERASRLPLVEVILGSRAEAIDQEGEGVRVRVGTEEITADYLVGCDGSHSMVRESAGIGETRRDHDRKMVLLVFRSTQLHRILEGRFGEASFFNVLHPDLNGYWRFLGRVDVGEGWFFHAPVEAGSTVHNLDWEALLHDTVGQSFDLQLEYVGFWDLRIAFANTYRNGRVFVAGDAAHSHPPYGGYGINTGLEDARNLAWKLAGDLQGWAGSGLLESYTEERRPVFASTATDFIEAFIQNDREFIGKYDPKVDLASFSEAWERRRLGSNLGVSVFDPHYEGSPIVFGPPSAVSSAAGTHSLEARAGHRLPPPASGPALFDSLGLDWTLLHREGVNDAADAFVETSRRMGFPLQLLNLEESDMAAYGADMMLVRPDHFVSWVGDGDEVDVSHILEKSTGSVV